MARRRIVELLDDLDGGAAEETVTFALDGRSYEIDLSEKNAEELRAALAPYVAAGRRLIGRRPSQGGGRIPRQSEALSEAGAIRIWAQQHGYEVNARGRIPAHVREAYEAR